MQFSQTQCLFRTVRTQTSTPWTSRHTPWYSLKEAHDFSLTPYFKPLQAIVLNRHTISFKTFHTLQLLLSVLSHSFPSPILCHSALTPSPPSWHLSSYPPLPFWRADQALHDLLTPNHNKYQERRPLSTSLDPGHPIVSTLAPPCSSFPIPSKQHCLRSPLVSLIFL